MLPVRDCFGRVLERKKTLLVFSALFLIAFLFGIILTKSPAMYDYHLTVCDRFIDRVCFSRRSVFLIFLEHVAGSALLLALFLIAGIHRVGLILPPAMIVYRAYMCGGSTAIFFSVYGFSGVLIALVLYLPIRILTDLCFLCATTLSCARAGKFRFCREDFACLAFDFLILFLLILAIYFVEMVLLLALFHPIGNML